MNAFAVVRATNGTHINDPTSLKSEGAVYESQCLALLHRACKKCPKTSFITFSLPPLIISPFLQVNKNNRKKG